MDSHTTTNPMIMEAIKIRKKIIVSTMDSNEDSKKTKRFGLFRYS